MYHHPSFTRGGVIGGPFPAFGRKFYVFQLSIVFFPRFPVSVSFRNSFQVLAQKVEPFPAWGSGAKAPWPLPLVMDRRTDGHYPVHYLPTTQSYEVDKHVWDFANKTHFAPEGHDEA